MEPRYKVSVPLNRDSKSVLVIEAKCGFRIWKMPLSIMSRTPVLVMLSMCIWGEEMGSDVLLECDEDAHLWVSGVMCVSVALFLQKGAADFIIQGWAV